MEGISALSDVLDASYSVTCLYLSENSLTNRDVAPLIKSLQSNFFLTTLDLSYNKITFENGQDLTAFLTNNETLITLDLRWCLICDKGGLALAKGLKRNVSLKVLDVSWNGLGERGLKNLALALAYNNCLKAINLANNNLTPKTTVHLARALKRNKSLEVLILDNNTIRDDNTRPFIQLCLGHSSLMLLSLQGVHLGKKMSFYIQEMQYIASEETHLTKIVLLNDCNDMHVVNETLVRSFLQLLSDFIRQNGHSLEASFKSIDKSRDGYLGLESTIRCLEKTGFHIPLKSMKDLIKKIARENLEKIPYCIFFDDTIKGILKANKQRLKRFEAVAKYL
ncbi:leucine-rich repeat-containing protein 74B-like isoform X2 [Octopus vulgaris]|uniref:Leucine-rich repeat-containing protein 74B-like isoform X2 n=1 Tax=Octopus vulgaris TaxID=6645 RepID=A0AA36BPV7_OCTVU|nr:leucine-rich repeat-containing protein 74B-like isoform X2 [Octopus vulgaris]